MAPAAAPVLVSNSGRPLQQGDVFVTSGMVRIAAGGDAFVPPTWAEFETRRLALEPQKASLPALDAAGGRALVTVVSHDCQLDKELHHAARALMKADPDLSEDAAYDRAEDDDTLDRHVVVSPLIELAALPLAADPNTAGLLRAGRIVGYLPVPAQDPILPRDAVVDLSYRATVERNTLTDRLAALSDDARLALRYALARMDSLGTPDIGAELEAAIGLRIMQVIRPDAKNPTIRMRLEDGTAVEMLPRPAVNPPQGAGRQRLP
jgi:hypothetical protein